MTWLLIQINQLPFCSVHHKGLNSCPDLNLSMYLALSFHCQIKLRFLVPHLMPTLLWRLKALSSSCFYHICSFSQICSSLDDSMAVFCIRTCFFVPGSVELYGISLKHTAHFNESSVQWLGLSCTSNIVHLHCL